MTSAERKQVGLHIAKLRRAKGITQSNLAEMVGVTFETISRLERGITLPSISTLEKIGTALDLPLKVMFDFGYNPRTKKKTPIEKEIDKIIIMLKPRRLEEIRLVRKFLNNIFKIVKIGGRQKKRG